MAKQKNREPQYYNSALNNQVLNYRVYRMSGPEGLLYRTLTMVAGGAVGLIFYGGLFKADGVSTIATYISNIVIFVGVGLIATKVFFPVLNESLRQKRLSKLKLQFRDFLSAIAASLSSGMTVITALTNARKDLEMQYSGESLIVVEVDEMINGVNNNIPFEDMLADFGKRSGVEDISNFAVVFATCYRTGGNLKDVVRRTADIIGEKMIISEEIKTKITSNKMQMQVMNIIPIVLVLMMRVMSSEFARGFASPIGIASVTVGVGLFVGAYMLGQKYMNIEG
jgi:tight adherence protein B